MNEIELQEYIKNLLETEEDVHGRSNHNDISNSNNSVIHDVNGNMKVGILGCGAITNIITDFALKEDLDVDLRCFYDQDLKKAESMASKVGGTATSSVEDMLDQVDLVVEAASPQAVVELAPKILEEGKDIVVMSVGTLLDSELKNRLEEIALITNSRIYTPSGAIVGLDGLKAASMGEISKVSLVTRKSPESLGISVNKETILYEGKASAAVRKFPMNMNVAGVLSIACGKEAHVKIIADPTVEHNIHEVRVTGDFGEFKTTTKNRNCTTNPKTSILAAYSVIKLLKSLNDAAKIGT
ncbi:aspartate dehydrogenase [Methanobacterium petrolearium]|nr:aspartate dehydrogenase [Methanobacterium petrolearium]